MACAQRPHCPLLANKCIVLCALALTGSVWTALQVAGTNAVLANDREQGPTSDRPGVAVADMAQGMPGITPSSAFNLAYKDYLMGRYELAVRGFQRFIKDFPWSSLIPKAHFWLGKSYYNLKDYERAIQTLEYLVAQYPHHEMVPVALFRLSFATAETGDLVTAEQYRQRLIHEFPTSTEAALVQYWMAEMRGSG